MGKAGKAYIPEAQFGDPTGRTVSTSHPLTRAACRVLSRLDIFWRDGTSLTCAYSQLDMSQYKPALALIDTLLTELKRLDDKMILTEVHLQESRVYRGVGNLAKAKVRSASAPGAQ